MSICWSPNVHMLIWVRNATDMEISSEDDIQKFVYKLVSCAVPEDNEGIAELLLLVQRHALSLTCRKHDEACSLFHFPRLPVRHTNAFKPMEEEVPGIQPHKKYTKKSLQQYMNDWTVVFFNFDQDSQISLDSVLEKTIVAEEQYTRALRWIKQKVDDQHLY